MNVPERHLGGWYWWRSTGVNCTHVGWWLGIVVAATLTLVPLVVVVTLTLYIVNEWDGGAFDKFIPLGLVEGTVKGARACSV